jgi:predicted RNA-binding Zn ribbon-like protein
MSSRAESLLPAFLGGRVCLDFANTVGWRTSEAPLERLPDYAALLGWSERRRTLSRAAVRRLRLLAAADPVAGEEVGRQARELRRAISRAAEDLVERRPVNLSEFNRRLATLPRQPGTIRQRDTYLHDLGGDHLEEPLWPVLWSLTALLTSDDAQRVGCCGAQGCGWFFVDESPNRSRLWCSSETCGNRERVRRAYARRRARNE